MDSPHHQNLCRTQWARVGSNMDYRDNSLVYHRYITLEKFLLSNEYNVSSEQAALTRIRGIVARVQHQEAMNN